MGGGKQTEETKRTATDHLMDGDSGAGKSRRAATEEGSDSRDAETRNAEAAERVKRRERR